MAQITTTGEFGASVVSRRAARKLNLATLLSRIVFASLVFLTVATAIPHGSSQPWWKALFICLVFALAVPWLIEGYISGGWFKESWSLALPLAILAAFSFLQTFSFPGQLGNPVGVGETWRSISADPYQTRFFALELLALTITGVMLFRYGSSQRRIQLTISVVICVAVATALFGLLRQTTHPSVLFGLPFLPAQIGYGQFVNRNHFAFLMEMGLGLILGLLLGGGIRREQGVVYLAALLVVWIALVLCSSRGGLLAMLAQVIVAALLFGTAVRAGGFKTSRSKLFRMASSLPVRLALLVVLIVGIVFGTVWLGGDQLASRIDQAQDELSVQADPLRQGVSRQEIWKASWTLFTAHPVLGVGMGAYWAAVPSVHDASGSMTPR